MAKNCKWNIIAASKKLHKYVLGKNYFEKSFKQVKILILICVLCNSSKGFVSNIEINKF